MEIKWKHGFTDEKSIKMKKQQLLNNFSVSSTKPNVCVWFGGQGLAEWYKTAEREADGFALKFILSAATLMSPREKLSVKDIVNKIPVAGNNWYKFKEH